jgi:NADH-quinone oxidoreductase subunit N
MNPQMLLDLRNFYPELILTTALLAVIIAELVFSRLRRSITFSLAALGLILAFIASLFLFRAPMGTAFWGILALDPMAVFFKCFLILTSFLVLLTVPGSRELAKRNLGEFYMLLLGVTLAMLLLAASTDILMLYLSLEMVSICSYILVGYLKNDRQSNEASLKYLLFGAVSSGCMLYGFTILYGLTGTTQLAAIREILSAKMAVEGNFALPLIAITMTLAGFGFKTAAVPFHFWCPDVYSGAPTPVTAFLSVAPKAAGFAILIRFFFTGLSHSSVNTVWSSLGLFNWQLLLLIMSIITMTLGNIAALRQDNMKRMLAYSSIAHAGYISWA